MRAKRLWATVLCAGLTASVLTGCGAEQEGTGTQVSDTTVETSNAEDNTTADAGEDAAPEQPAEKVELHYAYWQDSLGGYLEECKAKFEAENENVTIVLEPTAWAEYWTKLETAATGGSVADVFQMNGPNIHKYADAGVILSLDDYIEMINISEPSLIRTEADELTYPLHILIRYELEKEMINGNIDFDHLDEIWANKYEEYLGVRPTNPVEGILQDIHWSGGSFGYFPTYALGSAFSAQFFKAMQEDINVDEALENNQFEIVENWLKDNIHTYGALYPADVIMNKVCKQSFDPNVYCDYLIDKFTNVYKL